MLSAETLQVRGQRARVAGGDGVDGDPVIGRREKGVNRSEDDTLGGGGGVLDCDRGQVFGDLCRRFWVGRRGASGTCQREENHPQPQSPLHPWAPSRRQQGHTQPRRQKMADYATSGSFPLNYRA